MSNSTQFLDRRVVPVFLSKFHKIIKKAYDFLYIQNKQSKPSIQQFVRDRLGENYAGGSSYYKDWFVDQPVYNCSDRDVTRTMYMRLRNNIIDEEEKLRLRHRKEITPSFKKTFTNLDKIFNLYEDYCLKSKNLGKYPTRGRSGALTLINYAGWNKLLISSGIDNVYELYDINKFILFVTRNVDLLRDTNKNNKAIDNAKFIVKAVAGRNDERHPDFSLTQKTAWLGTYACLRGALVASSVEDHNAAFFFEYRSKEFAQQYKDDVFIQSANRYITFLAHKHFLDMYDKYYPLGNPGIGAYLLFDLNGSSAYEVPRFMYHAMFYAAAVEARHEGFLINSRLDFTDTDFETFHEKGIEEADKLDGPEASIRLRLSKAWSYIRSGDYEEAEKIVILCNNMLKLRPKDHKLELDIEYVIGVIAISTAGNASQRNVAVTYLRTLADKFALFGAHSLAKNVYKSTKK